jgi:hypothetical protein
MKHNIIKWSFRVLPLLLLAIGLLIALILNPSVLYVHKTKVGRFTIHHNSTLDPAFLMRLQEAAALTNKSEIANPNFHMQVCLGGSFYPALIKRLLGKGFAWGFYNTIVIAGTVEARSNRHESGWNLSQLLAHEMTHCLQFKKYGLLKSNPIAGYPLWKWEGYPEYVARQSRDQKNLQHNIEQLLKAEQTAGEAFVYFADSTRTIIPYYQNWLLVQYCMDIKIMSYDQVLKDTLNTERLRSQMMQWYQP